MRRKYSKNKVKKVQPEEKLYTKAELNKAKVEGWNRAIESLAEQINQMKLANSHWWFISSSMEARKDVKDRVLKLLNDNVYPS